MIGKRVPNQLIQRVILAMVVLLLLSVDGHLFAQAGIFFDDWDPRKANIPSHQSSSVTSLAPNAIITIDFSDTTFKIPPFITGFNQPVHQKGRFDMEPQAVRHTKNVRAQVLRYPGGTAAMTFFWDRRDIDGPPSDVDTYIRTDEVYDDFRLGMSGGDFFSVEHYYNFLDSVPSMTGILVINYGYARYGRSEKPVQQAAHYAAEWVRYDNGRTKFWEIGNELSGRWTPGHTIDVSKNKDGQPEIITGGTYAEHFRVFADSMKAAAAEIGYEIYIGGVLSHTESSWNREFLENAGDVADFTIVHEYYGAEGVTDPVYAVNSSDALKEHVQKAAADISLYADRSIPLVLTEWNTKDEGQNDRCIYGMSNMRGIMNIIESGTNLACRHTLLHSNARGLVNNAQVYDPDLGYWQPRSTFFYFYYMQSVLGDTWHGARKDIQGNIDVMATSFHSGEVGLVLLNKSAHREIVALNMSDYTITENYYLYSLVPEDGNPFSKKVLVNGRTNGYYPAGGPFEYEDVPAKSFNTEGLVKIELQPFSANYILAKGRRILPGASSEVNIGIYGNTGDSIELLPGAMVALNSQCGLSKTGNYLTLNVVPGVYTLEIQMNGFDNIKRIVEITGDTLLVDTLQVGAYNLDLVLKDQDSRLPVGELSVSIDEVVRTSNQAGEVSFMDLSGGEKTIYISGPGYTYSGKEHLYSDTVYTIYLEKENYEVAFQIADRYSGRPLNGISVNVGGEQKYTDLEGLAKFDLVAGEYLASIIGSQYAQKNLELKLTADTLVAVEMEATYAEVKFIVDEEGTPLRGVEITVEDKQAFSNALGMCTFSGLATQTVYHYNISFTGYEDVNDTVFLLTDTTINVRLLRGTSSAGDEMTRIFDYPLILNGSVYLRADQPVVNVSIFNILGREVITYIPEYRGVALISLENLEPGVYLMVVQLPGKILSNRFVVTN